MRQPLNSTRPLLFLLLFASLGFGGCATHQGIKNAGQLFPPPSTGESATANQFWPVFERYQGTPYQWGGTTANGFDCSGFIITAYSEALGKQLPRTTSQMLATGEFVSRDRIQPGDIVFFRIEGKDQHAGIYMGNNRFIHASSSVGVTQSSLNGYYWRNRYSQARRFLE
jgi:cell wall-associated NlpC family hydrolase